ncbi:MAG: site-specific integrase [Planctomycetota bacterium]|nr:site-specific integrase [Planctomycetota bacterium]
MPRTTTIHYEQKRGRHYFTLDGTKHTRKRYADAVELLNELTAEQRPAPGGKITTIAELVERWLAQHPKKDNETIRWRLKPWWQFEGDVALRSFGRDGLYRYLDHLENKTDYGKHTVRDMMGIAGHVCRWGYIYKYLAEVPLSPKLQKAPVGKKSVPVREFARKYDAMNGKRVARARSIFDFIQGVGCRPIEGRRLDWDEVDLEEGVITLDVGRHKVSTITGEPIKIYIDRPYAPEVRQALLDAANRDGMVGTVFRSRLGTPYTPSGLRSILKRHTGITPYALRHTMITDGMTQEHPEDISCVVGHKDAQTTQIYGQLTNSHGAEVAKRLVSPLQHGRALNQAQAESVAS